MNAAGIAINRFGLGGREGEAVPADPRRWLTEQLDRFEPAAPALSTMESSRTIGAALAEYGDQERRLRREDHRMRSDAAPSGQPVVKRADPALPLRRQVRHEARDLYTSAVAARFNAALVTPAPFAERLVHFWANHFAVSAEKASVVALSASLEMEAIRPHVTGRFADMLLAVGRHPAMLLYLDQAVSIGPNSTVGRLAEGGSKKKVGLNENLAREVMELHTLGARTGYTQADVTEFARALTGWTVAGLGKRGTRAPGTPGAFTFAADFHEPGARSIMGKRYDGHGEDQAHAVLDDLAGSPATAAHLATKLARHFAGDAPPPALVERLTAAYLRSGGDLPTVYCALIDAPEAWVSQPVKFRTPWEWAIACHRALGTRQVEGSEIVGLMNQLGQPVWKPGQPAGYDDLSASWAGPDAVMRRVEAAERLADRASETDVRALSAALFAGAPSPATAQAIARAESPAQALALLLVAPEMMRR